MATWFAKDNFIGVTDLGVIDPTGAGFVNLVAGTGSGRNVAPGAIIRGTNADLGDGEFIFLKGVASLVVGDVVTYNGLTGATTRWAGTAITGMPVAIAITLPSSTQWGWFQIGGNAIATVSGTVTAGDSAYYNAAGSIKSAAVAGKQIVNLVAALANGGTAGGTVLTSTQAVYTIQRPFAQGAIT